MKTTRTIQVLIAAALLTLGSAKSAVAADGDSSGTRGGFYIEPGVTYEFNSKSTINFPSPLSNSSGSIEGLGASLKGGFHVSDIIFGGADFRYSQPKFKDSSNNLETESKSMNYGVLLGAQTGLYGIRAWGEYVFGGSLDPKEDNGIDYKFEEAMGYRLGAGIRVKMLSINLEYQDLKYDKTHAVAGGIPVSSDNSELTNKALVGSVSFPFDM